MNSDIIIKRFELLPESIQLQVADYIDFLLSKYIHTTAKELNATEIDKETQELFDQRIALHLSDTSKAKHWEETLSAISAKFNYEL